MLEELDQFKCFGDRELKALLSLSQLREYQRGDLLIEEGEYGCRMYILLQGSVELVKKGKVLGLIRKKGELLGEMGIVNASPRSATIRAAEFTQALSFDAAIIDHELNRNELSFCYVIFRLISEVLAERLRNTTNVASDYHKVLARFGNP